MVNVSFQFAVRKSAQTDLKWSEWGTSDVRQVREDAKDKLLSVFLDPEFGKHFESLAYRTQAVMKQRSILDKPTLAETTQDGRPLHCIIAMPSSARS